MAPKVGGTLAVVSNLNQAPTHKCRTCHGKGRVPGMVKTEGWGMGSRYGTCPDCGGTGYISESDADTYEMDPMQPEAKA